MSYDLVSPCGCTVRVVCHPDTGAVRSRVIEERSAMCHNRRHRVGERFWVWELLPGGGPETAGQAQAFPRA